MKELRIIVAGGRDFDNYEFLRDALDQYLERYWDQKDITIISGRAIGADRLGEMYADKRDIRVECFEPDWMTYGKYAGPIRNKCMAEYAAEEGYHGVLFAFWDGESRGTKNMIETAEKYNLEVYVMRY
jgi:hypothetical protein